MIIAWILAITVLLWYCAKESRKSNPNWARAIVSAIFWPFTPFLKDTSSGGHKAKDI